MTGLVRSALVLGKLSGVKLGKSTQVEVYVLQFADDTLFMGEASMQNVLTIKCILRCFELASGLKVNFLKSCCVGLGVLEHELQIF